MTLKEFKKVFPKLHKELVRLGVEFKPDAPNEERTPAKMGIHYFYNSELGEWRDEDPKGEFLELSPEMWFLTTKLKWPYDRPFKGIKPGEYITFGGIDRIHDVVFSGKRRLLYNIALTINQFEYSINLLDVSGQFYIYSIDHDSTDPSKVKMTLASFLSEVSESDKTFKELGF